MKRGDIFYIARRDTVGAEIQKARPAVIISADNLNHSSGVVEVVYLTRQPKNDIPTHVTIRSTGMASTVICEQIDTVSTQLVGNYCGTCTAAEMERIDCALRVSLGLDEPTALEYPVEQTTDEQDEDVQWLQEELERVQAERDRYAKMLDYFLGGNA